jgi:hypothetical protein
MESIKCSGGKFAPLTAF